MSQLGICLTVLYGLSIACLGASLYANVRLWAHEKRASRLAESETSETAAVLAGLRCELDDCASQIAELLHNASQAPPPGRPRAGLNLTKRSQALRMHRRGDSAAQIAAALEIPLQEVELLLKVHRIVISAL